MSVAPQDLLRLTFVADPRLAPGRDAAVVTVTRIVPGEGDDPPRYRTRLHRIELATGEATVLTRGDGRDAKPRFDPAGARLAFLRKEGDGRPQLFVLPLAGGEARPLSAWEAGITDLAWLPDGRGIVAVAPAAKSVPHQAGRPLRVTRARYREEGKDFVEDVPGAVLLFDPAAVFDGPVEPRVVAELHAPASEVAVSPDGRVAYALAPTQDAEHAEMRKNLLAIDLDDGRATPLLPAAVRASSLAVDPGTGLLSFVAARDEASASTPAGLWRVRPSGGAPELVSGDLDAAPSVAGDSRYGDLPATPLPRRGGWICAVNEAGRSNLAWLGADGTREDLTAGDRAITAFDGDLDLLVYVSETPDRPGELFVRSAEHDDVRITSFHDDLVAELELARPEGPIDADVDGARVAYWRLEPRAPRDDRAMVVEVHGGPAANYGYGFFFEFQLLAARGYTVVYGNPRGGSSFGPDFSSAVQGRYGTVDADDVMAIVEHAAARHPRPDAPVHLTGGSYGGFLTNWLVGRTDRFRSAVTQRSISNFVSFYGTSDIGPWFVEREARGTPWEDLAKLWDQSPLKHVANVQTPLLILHTENDRRCPIEQAEQLYAALKRIGRAPTELVRFPDDGHELSRSGRPDRRIARLEAIVGWFERFA